MKKVLITSLVFGVFLTLSSVVSAKVERVPGPWEFSEDSELTFVCGGNDYAHTLEELTNENGVLTGSGYYNANMAYTWDLDGTLDGQDFMATVVYTGANSGYTLNLEGTVNEDGSVEGTTDGNCETFSLEEGTAYRYMGNHGQYVKMMENKKEAAHSRVGMPVHSKGHTK